MSLQLHLACGDIYLAGYVNCDINGRIYKEGDPNPNSTTIDNYYQYQFKVDKPREFIVDKLMNILEPWDFEDQSVDRIVMISAIEHFTKKQAEFIIVEIKRVLKPGGELIIDFPDIFLDVIKYIHKDDDFLAELIYCNHKNEYSIHKWMYTFDSFKKLLGEGWGEIRQETFVTHDYPMLGIKAIRA